MVFYFAEREGFEPPVHCCTMVFKTTAFDHSAISPFFDSGANIKHSSKLQTKKE
jgi:hypothetical protein